MLATQASRVSKDSKETWEREASRVIWDLQVHKEKLVKEEGRENLETLAKKVSQEQEEMLATQATRVRRDNKV